MGNVRVVAINLNRIQNISLLSALNEANKWLLDIQLVFEEEINNVGINYKNVWDYCLQLLNDDGVKTLFIAGGAGGFAGANNKPPIAIVGDIFVYATSMKQYDAIALYKIEEANRMNLTSPDLVEINPDIFTRNAQIGAMIHEVLHMFGFNHEDGGIMAEWYNWPNTYIPVKMLYQKVKLSWWQKLLQLIRSFFS